MLLWLMAGAMVVDNKKITFVDPRYALFHREYFQKQSQHRFHLRRLQVDYMEYTM